MEWNIGQILKKRAAFTPARIALIYEDQPFDYAKLNRHTNRMADYLKSLGLSHGDRVAADLFNCPEFVCLYFACAKLGLIFVPLNFRLTGPELEYQINNSKACFLAFHDTLTQTIESIRDKVSIKEGHYLYVKGRAKDAPSCPKWATEYAAAENGRPETEPLPAKPVKLDDPLAIIYTSGVTGAPKGAVVSHGQTYFKNFQIMLYFALHQEDIYLCQLPLFHSAGIFVFLTPAFCAGATAVMRTEFDPERFAKDIESHRATFVFALTTMWKFVLDSGILSSVDVSSVKRVFGGGERTPPSLIDAMAAHGLHMQQGFGQTENSAMMMLPKEDLVRKHGSIGLPGYFTDIWIEDGAGRRLPPGQIGEIVASGPTVMSGYWEMPEATEKTIVDGVLKTGDLGYMDEEGYFYIVDRVKSMYRTGGENVYPAEVEKVLAAHPAILHVTILGVPDTKCGETGKAFVVPVEGQTVTLEDLRHYLDGKLARFKHPTQLEILEEMPMTTSGKIQRSALSEMTRKQDLEAV